MWAASWAYKASGDPQDLLNAQTFQQAYIQVENATGRQWVFSPKAHRHCIAPQFSLLQGDWLGYLAPKLPLRKWVKKKPVSWQKPWLQNELPIPQENPVLSVQWQERPLSWDQWITLLINFAYRTAVINWANMYFMANQLLAQTSTVSSNSLLTESFLQEWMCNSKVDLDSLPSNLDFNLIMSSALILFKHPFPKIGRHRASDEKFLVSNYHNLPVEHVVPLSPKTHCNFDFVHLLGGKEASHKCNLHICLDS